MVEDYSALVMSSQQKPGWYDVPGKGRRYWNGANYQFYGPSDNAASKGQMTFSNDIGGMWNNFVGQYGSSTSDPSKVGAQNYTQEEARAEIERRKRAREGSETPPTAQPPQGSRGLPSDYKATEQAAGQTAEAHRPGAGFSPTLTSRSTPAPNGGAGSGTQTSPRPMTMDEANKLLTGGYTVQNPFGSNQLPATSASPYYDENPDVNFNRDLPENMFEQEDGLRLTRNAFDAQSGVEYGADTLQQPATGAIEAAQLQGAPLTVSSGTFKVTQPNETAQKPEVNKGTEQNSGTNWGARTAADNSDPNIARRRAFLDADSSLQGLRRIEAQQGIVVAGGQYNMVNPNAGKEGENDFMKIDKKQRDTIMRGGEGAQNLLNSYTSAINESGDAPEPRTDYSFDSPDVEDPDESIRGTTADLPKGWLNR